MDLSCTLQGARGQAGGLDNTIEMWVATREVRTMSLVNREDSVQQSTARSLTRTGASRPTI